MGFLSATLKAEVADKCFEQLPAGCFVIKSIVIPQEQTEAIGNKLGVSLEKLSNTYLKIQGKPIQVNILEAKSKADAEKLHETLLATKENPAFCLISGLKVIEFCKADAITAIKTAYELGFSPKPKQVQYVITVDVATIDQADYMKFNELFNLFLNTNMENPSEESMAHIKTLASGFNFGNSLTLRKQPNQGQMESYSFSPNPNKVEDLPDDEVVYSFNHLPDALGVPYVTLTAKIVCNDTGTTPTERKTDPSLLAATPFWPVDDPDIKKLAKSITVGQSTQEEKVQAILEWLTPNKNIKMEGPTGSRWGVNKVLKQRYGHCWDSSDCFVTLARAAGIPSRQVGGWLYGSSGHIWAEVLLDGKGWQQVDPTGGGKLTCGIYHIPYFTTESGEMPILYLDMPKIEIAETE